MYAHSSGQALSCDINIYKPVTLTFCPGTLMGIRWFTSTVCFYLYTVFLCELNGKVQLIFPFVKWAIAIVLSFLSLIPSTHMDDDEMYGNSETLRDIETPILNDNGNWISTWFFVCFCLNFATYCWYIQRATLLFHVFRDVSTLCDQSVKLRLMISNDSMTSCDPVQKYNVLQTHLIIYIEYR